jgi:hypothetical protein
MFGVSESISVYQHINRLGSFNHGLIAGISFSDNSVYHSRIEEESKCRNKD